MQPLDILVGAIAILLGLFLTAGAALDAPWLMALAKPRLVAGSVGKSAARLLLATLGIGLIGLGIAIARGWRVHWG